MENATKWILGGSAVMGALALLSTTRLARFAQEFILVVSPRIQSVGFDKLVLAIDITFKNPTDATLTIKHPTITVFDSLAAKTANQPILSSQILSTVYTIKPNTESKLNPILLTVSTFDVGLALSARRLIRSYLAGSKITLYARALTQINGAVPIVKELESSFQMGTPVVSKPARS